MAHELIDELALNDEGRRLSLALDAGGLATWDWHMPSGKVIWNDRHFRMLGYQPGAIEPSYEAWVERIHPEDRQATEDTFRRAMEEATDYSAAFRVVWPEGTVRWVEARGRLDRDNHGQVLQSYGVMQDITRFMGAEESPKESETRFLATLKNVPITVASLDRELRYTWVYNTRHGFTPEQVIGKRPDELIAAESASGIMSLLQRVQDTGIAESQLVSGDTQGQPWHYSVYVEPRKDSAGMTVGLNAAMVDITDRLLAEDELRRTNDDLERRVVERTAELAKVAETLEGERQRLYEVLKSLPAFVVLLMPDHRVVFANRYFEDQFGEVRGRTCYETLFQRQSPCEDCPTFRTLASKEPIHREWAGPDGRHYETSALPFTDVDGSPLIMKVGIDITKRKQAEGALLQRSEQLSQLATELTLAEHMERKRLAQILHDGLQQLLVAAKYRVGALEQDANPAVRNQAHGLNKILTESIETSRTLTYELSPPVLSERGLVPALEWLKRWKKAKYGLSVELEVSGDLSSLPENISIFLFQAARELLFNVVKHAETKSAQLLITKLDGWIQVSVADQGTGFDKTTLRLSGGETGGLGLLSIGERLALLGGHMGLESTPGGGSRITLQAPLPIRSNPRPYPTELSDRPTADPLRQGPILPPDSLEPIRVLLVDDHVVVRQGLATLLKQNNKLQIVGEAADGEAAIALIRLVRPDVVLMDISMPGMGGMEATRVIHSDFPEVKVIGLSMHSFDDMGEAMLSAGAQSYVSKGDSPESILGVILSCGQGHSGR